MHNLQTTVYPASLSGAASSEIIRSGDILHVRNKGFIGRAIRRAIGSWGNHDGIFVRPENNLCVGESTWPRGRFVDLAEYDRLIASRHTQAIVIRPSCASAMHGSLAAAWWIRNAQGRPYDLGAYPRLLLKSILGDRCPWPAGWNWAWYCTESCRDAWRNGPNLDPWAKTNPTPRTTEKRLADGAFTLIWSSHQAPSTKNQEPSTFPQPSTKHQEPNTFPQPRTKN
jgi:hypothetical protein